jgi:hypothetical protein
LLYRNFNVYRVETQNFASLLCDSIICKQV